MFNRIIAWSLKNRFIIFILTLFLCLFGGYALNNMSLDVFPEFAPPQVVVQTEAPGMPPVDIEKLITYPLESVINGIPGVTAVRSKTSAGLSSIVVIFDDRTDIFRDRQLINEKIQTVISKLPPNAKSPVMLPVISAVGWLVKYALVSDVVSPQVLRTISDWQIRPRILALGGVASVQSIGGEVKQYQVIIDPTKLLAYDISIKDIKNALLKSNINVPGSYIQKDGTELIVGAIGRIQTLEDLKETVIKTRETIPITIGNVAEVKLGAEIKRGDAAYNLQNAVIGTISKSYGADTLKTTYKIENALAEIKTQLPNGVELKTDVFRQANFIESAITNLSMAFLKGAFIVLIILFVFLMNWRASLITFLSMPISFVGGIVILYFFGVGINVMTLGGLVIAIGEVVDDGIITVENVVRRLRLNRNRKNPSPTLKIVYEAVLEIRNSVIYATMIVCMVFIPIFFLQDITQKIFSPLALAYIASVASSLIVSVTLIPALCYLLLVRKDEKIQDTNISLHDVHIDQSIKNHGNADQTVEIHAEPILIKYLKYYFSFILDWSINHLKWVISIATSTLLFALILIPFFGRTFLPEFHEGNYIIAMATLPGTSLNESMRIGKIVREKLLAYPQVVSISQRAGRSELDEDAWTPNVSEFDVQLDFDKGNHEDPDKLIQRIRDNLNQIPGVSFNIGQFISHRMDEVLSGVRAQVAIKIYGENLATLNQLATSIELILRKIPGVVDINKEQQIEVPQVVIRIDRDKAAHYGLNIGDVAEQIQLYLNGETLSSILEDNQSYDLFVRVMAESRNNIEMIKKLLIDAPTLGESAKIPLSEVALVSIENQPFAISRENVQRTVTIAFNTQGRSLNKVVDDVQTTIQKQITLSPGYYIHYVGQYETQKKANLILSIFSIVILLFAAMLLFKAFGTLRETFLVMLNIPFAFIGGVISLYLSGAELSIAAMIGFITLFGITMRNGIILVSHYHQLQKLNFSLEDVIKNGTLDRLVPVLMTATTAALALMPILFGAPTGKELERPLAQVLLGGLITSTILNLIVIPTLYFHLEKRHQKQAK